MWWEKTKTHISRQDVRTLLVFGATILGSIVIIYSRNRIKPRDIESEISSTSPRQRRKTLHKKKKSSKESKSETSNIIEEKSIGFDKLSEEELLFFGCIPVYLSPTCGSIFSTPVEWVSVLENERENLENVSISRLNPLKDLGKQYKLAVVPATPRLDPVPGKERKIWPEHLGTQPLLKVPESCRTITGIASGIRSALIKVENDWYRLKGCGNSDQGFPVEIKGDNGEVNVRGCCFEHTALCELEMSEKIQSILSTCSNISCANQSIGYFHYKSGRDWPLPKIQRFCAVFKSNGNRRLGDHLLVGVEQLIPLICPFESRLFEYLEVAIQAKRSGETCDSAVSQLMDTANIVACEMEVANLSDFTLQETAPPNFMEMKARGFKLSYLMKNTWDSSCIFLRENLLEIKQNNQTGSILLTLAWQLGWECGRTLNLLHDAHISWGTFPDEMGVHCNAHANNFVVQIPDHNDASQPFLSPLDFDMSFSKDNFIPQCVFRANKLPDVGFEELLSLEQNCLGQVLAGSQFVNTGVSNERNLVQSHRAVYLAFRDTIVSGYQAGYTANLDGATIPPTAKEVREAAICLVKLALVITADDIG